MVVVTYCFPLILTILALFQKTSAQFCKDKNGTRLLRAHKWPKFNLTTCHHVGDYRSHLTSYLSTCQFEADTRSKHAPACNQACALDSLCAALVYSEEAGCEKCLFGGWSGVSGNERALDGMLVSETKFRLHINGEWLGVYCAPVLVMKIRIVNDVTLHWYDLLKITNTCTLLFPMIRVVSTGPCSLAPCQYDGTCSHVTCDDFTCDCPHYRTGKTCNSMWHVFLRLGEERILTCGVRLILDPSCTFLHWCRILKSVYVYWSFLHQ